MILRALLLVLALLLPGIAAAQQRVVNVYNWTDYIDPAALAAFTRETGITVNYDVYDSLETLEGKLLAGHSGYDVVVPTSEPTFSRLVRAGALAPLDRAAIPSLGGLDPVLVSRVAASDPGNAHGAIYLWGTIGLGVNMTRLRALAPDAPLDSWNLLLDPRNASRLAGCGITLLDSAIDVLPTMLRLRGHSPDSTAPADLADAEASLRAIRPFLRNFAGGAIVEALASGETCLALSYSGDVIQAASRAAEAGHANEIRYIAPREGAQLWFDMLAVPADAPHRAEAMAFIDFLLRPAVIAGITNVVHYPNAVPASRAMVRPEIVNDADVYPPAAALDRFFTIGAVPAEATRARARLWTRLKSGG